LSAAGLVWLMEAFRTYSPMHCKTNDIERERYEIQRRALDTKASLPRP